MKKIFFILITILTYCEVQAQTYDQWIDKSFEVIEQDSLSAAAETLKQAMRTEPANPRNFLLWSNLGTIQRRLNQKEEALQSYTAALSINPYSTTVLHNRATLYTEVDNIDKAIADYNLIILRDSLDPEARYCRGLLFIEKKDYLSAEQDFEHMLAANEKSVRGRMGYATLEKMRENYVESERIYNYLLSELPKESALYLGRAELFYKMGKNGRAMSDINKIFNEGEPDAYTYVLRGKIKLAQFEKKAAAKDFQTALEMGYNPKRINELMELCK